jgi:hypothetical protein
MPPGFADRARPDPPIVPVDLANPVERDSQVLAGIIQDFKGAAFACRKCNLSNRDPDQTLPAVEILDHELATPEFWIVTDAGEQFMNWLHADA